jgi:Protein of unknown function (DUF1254)
VNEEERSHETPSRSNLRRLAARAAATNAALAQAQPAPQAPAGSAVPVTVNNFRRAESDLVMGPIVKDGGFGKYVHHRALYPVDAPFVRPNRDTLYSFSIFDLDAGPVTITLPNAGQRFMSLQVIDGDQYTPEVHYGAGRHTFTREKRGESGCDVLGSPDFECSCGRLTQNRRHREHGKERMNGTVLTKGQSIIRAPEAAATAQRRLTYGPHNRSV